MNPLIPHIPGPPVPRMPGVPASLAGVGMRQITGFGRVGVQVWGMDRLQKAVRGMLTRGRDPRDIFELIAERMRSMQHKHFETEEDVSGRAWEPLSPATVEARRKGPGTGEPRILRDTGVMKASISKKAGVAEAIAGTNDPKAPFHQYGTGRIPRRQFIYLNSAECRVLVNMLTSDLIVDALRRGRVGEGGTWLAEGQYEAV